MQRLEQSGHKRVMYEGFGIITISRHVPGVLWYVC